MTDSPTAFIRCNLMSPCVEHGASKDGKTLRYRLADGNRFALKAEEAARVFSRLGFSIRFAKHVEACHDHL